MSAIMPVYRPSPIAFERGEGMRLFDQSGKSYLDFNAGIAVSCLGHAHPHLVKALQDQAAKLWHTTNLYTVPHQERLAQRLVDATFADCAFFTNSGTEAIECAVKVARKYFSADGRAERNRIIALTGAFHGRSMTAITATGKADGFTPGVGGFSQVPAGDLAALKADLGDDCCAVLLEPVQGEGGVVPLDFDYLRAVRQLCDDHGMLLILDEVQCGMGRTGTLFAHEQAGITPDLMAIAKGVGGGFPFGACLATADAAKHMTPGTHGSTYGGNPLAMAVGNAVLDEILKPGFLDRVAQMGQKLAQALDEFAARRHNQVVLTRGLGLMRGVKLRDNFDPRMVVAAALDQGLLVAPAGDNVIRLLPPLILDEADIAEAMDLLGQTLDGLEGSA